MASKPYTNDAPNPKSIPNVKVNPQGSSKSGPSEKPINDYIVCKNYMAPQVGGISKGLFEKFESRHEHNLVQLYCDSLGSECIGYAYNINGGYQFYSPNAWPMAEKGGWDFFMKQDPNQPLSLEGKGVKFEDIDAESQKKYGATHQSDKSDEKLDENQSEKSDESDKSNKSENESESKSETKKKYISYAQNVGRVNNQLVSFEAMIQYAMYYNRTLVIPWPRHRNHVMGFECGFWDFDRLREAIDIILEDQLPDHLQQYREEGDVPKHCRFLKLVGKGIPETANAECEMIYLYEGDMGIFHFRDGPQDVMKYIVPAPYIRNAVEDFLRDEFGELRYRVGVHRRAMKEGGVENGEIHVCRWESRGIHGDSRFQWLRNMVAKVADGGNDKELYERIIAIYHHSCAMDWDDLQNILVFHLQEALGDGEKFFIAHDHQEQFVIDNMKTHGGIEQPSAKKQEKYSSHEWSHAQEAIKVHREKCKDYGHCADQPTLQMKEEILFDMWALYYADFLAGTWMSTLTRTVCHWKGFEKSLYSSNQCFLKWKWEDTQNGKKTDWFTIDGLNETALFD